MIILRLNGGLGNQLFQYAAGRALAKMNSDLLKLDIRGYISNSTQNQIYRNLDIRDFNILAPDATNTEILQIKYPYGIASKVINLFKKKILRRYYIDWHPEILLKRGDIYLDGYFQCERYFIDDLNSIFSEFSLKSNLLGDLDDISKEILTSPMSVSLHIRRGDYVKDPRAKKIHFVCDENYYRRAILYMKNIYPNAIFFIFSDEIDWVKEAFSELNNVVYVSSIRNKRGELLRPSQELILMSQCRHHIISNSSFSWWGSYLNSNPNKIVVAPSIWRYGGLTQENIYPTDWIRFPVDASA